MWILLIGALLNLLEEPRDLCIYAAMPGHNNEMNTGKGTASVV
jgi:hypothetical protein